MINQKTNFKRRGAKSPPFFVLKINYGLIWYLVIPISEMLQQALNNAGIIRMSGIIPETLNRTGGSICPKEASK